MLAVEEESEESQVLGNEDAIAQLKRYANEIDGGAKRTPIMLVGPPGTGKSLAAHIVARLHNWNIVEMNASDYRDKESIDRLLLAAAQSRTIFGKKNVILLDEIDELAPRFDKGANSAIVNVIDNSKGPVIFIANDRWSQKISFLRTRVEYIEFKKLMPATITEILLTYSKGHGLNVAREVIEEVARKSNGDARCAINDLMVLDGAPKEALEIIGMRDKKMDVFNSLDKIFFSNTYSTPLAAVTSADVENDMLIKWIDENISKRYLDKRDLSMAYEMLSRATMFQNRASRSQYYTYWRYMNVMMSSGIALSKTSYPDRLKRYTFPKNISELSRSKESRGTKHEIAKKLKKRIHMNTARIIKYELRIIAEMVKSASKSKDEKAQEEMYDFLESKYGIEKKEVDWIVENVAT